ncbi:chemotaxis response regulator protein-glutamate methylesterase [Demequina sp. TTPB684]|uniref:protein-glutamate methylesterase/protein-glutamine glutaminase n=1 Tax=unclassified Demequina TaxID=2620311 RepID=UPI001CF55862|nr:MULTISPECIES: chemotaxis response regulator protein-glutamate methylesterase [unclassified Demequina]MCB2412903.1 chemotaxis response regulator protein-glutamate methylesterase [Demequina sp. TTPB684]UPU87872.1 chemotaxis response regulator protein-glutamate methylesterase [Demequina sp. TMPB413]
MGKIRVLVVDDSVVVRRLVSDALATDPDIDVVGVAQNGSIAVTKAQALHPDLITMDIEMPVMTGIEAVTAIRGRGLKMPIVMFSTLTEHGASATLDALAAGATDYVTKPTNHGDMSQASQVIGAQLLPKIKALFRKPTFHRGQTTLAPRLARPRTPRAVVIGSSTGGPEALSKVVSGLTTALPVPMLIVQHMPPLFTAQLAARLDRLGPHRVVEAKGGETLEAGVIYVAPGDYHLLVADERGRVVTRLSHGDQVNFCRPAVDVLFRSATDVFGPDLLGVVLTGMGADGREGSRAIVDAGGRVFAQDEQTSVVWGMPGAVATAGLAHQLFPITDVSEAIARAVANRMAPRAVTS